MSNVERRRLQPVIGEKCPDWDCADFFRSPRTLIPTTALCSERDRISADVRPSRDEIHGRVVGADRLIATVRRIRLPEGRITTPGRRPPRSTPDRRRSPAGRRASASGYCQRYAFIGAEDRNRGAAVRLSLMSPPRQARLIQLLETFVAASGINVSSCSSRRRRSPERAIRSTRIPPRSASALAAVALMARRIGPVPRDAATPRAPQSSELCADRCTSPVHFTPNNSSKRKAQRLTFTLCASHVVH
jgi:hypothetical protein